MIRFLSRTAACFLLWSALASPMPAAGVLKSSESPAESPASGADPQPGTEQPAAALDPSAEITLVVDTSSLKATEYYIPGRGVATPEEYYQYQMEEYARLEAEYKKFYTGFGETKYRVTEEDLLAAKKKLDALKERIDKDILINKIKQKKLEQDINRPAQGLRAQGEGAVAEPPPPAPKARKTGTENALVSTEEKPKEEEYKREWDKLWSW